MNVWEEQSEPDLHLAIVEQILGHWRYWYPYGWLRYPFSLNLTRIVKEAKLAVSAGDRAKATLEMPVAVPRPTGKRDLERLVARVRQPRLARPCRTVVVLDEVDRAAPSVAQSAVTLAARSLNLPGVVVLLSYVEELIRYKAFNPLVDCLPDLGSTMRAVVFTHGPDHGGKDAPGGSLSSAGPGSLAEWNAWENAEKVALTDTSDGGKDSGSTERVHADRDGRRLSDAVRLGFAYAEPAERKRLQARSAEKYLGSRPIQLRRLGLPEVAEIVVVFDTLNYLLDELLGMKVPIAEDVPERERVRAVIRDALKIYRDEFPDETEVPPLRVLEGELFRRLSGIHLPRGLTVSAQFVAAVVLAALHAATRQGSSPRGAW